MCFGGRPPSPPPPPPLPPPPPPPAPPTAPLPEAAPVETDINPQVREAKQKKPRNEMSRGTAELRIPLEGQVNTGGNAGSATGGLNK
tara:strand:- start:423 stop:683 length:261 start_codon:yes stop_codon:yes gene_type:complete